MKIEEIELFRVTMPMKEPWRTAFGEESEIDVVFVRVTMEGVDGWGETAPYRLPQYSPEWADGAFVLLRDVLAPSLVGRNVNSGVELQNILRSFKGNPFAKAGIDNAWWDAYAKLQGEPLWRLIGGKQPVVTVGADIAVMDSVEDLIDAVDKAQSAGFKRTKLKFRRGLGVDKVARVREQFPDATIHIDCNSGFTLDDLPMFRELDTFGLAMIEQPLAHDDLVDHARLQSELITPICLDESIVSIDRARKAIDIDACRWINIKPGRVGGLTNAIAIHDYCKQRHTPCWVGGMLESAVGQGPSLALSTLPNMRYPADIFPSDRLYSQDLSEPDIVLSAPSEVTAPSIAGHGFKPVIERLQRLTIERALVRSS
ncbi:MAG: o-succinylbenzoate synthase [marine bacterium B5-7]|nr:MAG: o-succinylbenzoate synthase [marine bacterium B5-7]